MCSEVELSRASTGYASYYVMLPLFVAVLNNFYYFVISVSELRDYHNMAIRTRRRDVEYRVALAAALALYTLNRNTLD